MQHKQHKIRHHNLPNLMRHRSVGSTYKYPNHSRDERVIVKADSI